MPRLSLTRCLKRRLRRSLTRRCTRRTVRRVGRGPRFCYLAQALIAFNRAVRARCRLARLAPKIFDTAVVRRRDEERAAGRQRLIELEPIMQKICGPATDLRPKNCTTRKRTSGTEMVQKWCSFLPARFRRSSLCSPSGSCG